MSHPSTFLPSEVLDRSRARERRARRWRGGRLAKLFRPGKFERRDALVVLLVLVALGSLVRYTRVLDLWFDRFNNGRPDELQATEALIGNR